MPANESTQTAPPTDTSQPDDRYVVWFDIDNTLYSKNSNVLQAMQNRILDYILKCKFANDKGSAAKLQHRLYKQYGLTIRGLVHEYDVDPLHFDRECDGSLPMDEMIQPNPSLRRLLLDIDRSKARVWALTNAYQFHARNVLRILRVEDQIEGLVFCDIRESDIICKPAPEYYRKALVQANLPDPSKCLFVDDDPLNVDAAKKMGWKGCVHFCERGFEGDRLGKRRDISEENGVIVIDDLERLRTVWHHIFTHPS